MDNLIEIGCKFELTRLKMVEMLCVTLSCNGTLLFRFVMNEWHNQIRPLNLDGNGKVLECLVSKCKKDCEEIGVTPGSCADCMH